ncbi:signal peptidase II [Streptomyces sp. ISL-44]|uniref:signal peptidase II n=1 Tax=Streptomyces sp. ISL-44 TaxID=2819184 RepID=UPI002034AF99|nr:signal peptidase II [Streptomyces sp. ISL-44]
MTTSSSSQPQRETAGTEAGARALSKSHLAALLAAAGLTYALDLGSKFLAVSRLENHEPVGVVGRVLTLQVIRNSGAAFSMGQAVTAVFTAIALAVVVVIVRASRKLHSLPWALALGLLLGGALGNLTDRIFRAPGVFRGHVVDFISVQHFAVFNLADSAIVCGGALMILLSFLGVSLDGTAPQDRRDSGIVVPG